MGKGLFIVAIIMLMSGHYFKTLRWKQSIEIYEEPSTKVLLGSLATGYLVNFFLPLRIGDVVRGIISGRKMKNGFSFSFSTVILDRYLDVIVVGVLFILYSVLGMKTELIIESANFYIIFMISLVVSSIIAVMYSKYIKKMMRYFSGIFNEKIELNILYFTWSIITSFKDMYRKIDKKKMLLNTIGMWGCYLLSYFTFAKYLNSIGVNIKASDIFTLLFSKGSLDASTMAVAHATADLILQVPTLVTIYLVAPLIVLIVYTLIPIKDKVKNSKYEVAMKKECLNLLPQVNSNDKLKFLDQYFSDKKREYLKLYLDINRNINIIQDYSAGSNATTMLCMNDKRTFYRKYAFAEDGKKLYEQILWLKEHKEILPLAEIIKQEHNDLYCFYDMEYNSNAVGLFSFIHSVPVDRSWAILKKVLLNLNVKLYTQNTRKADSILMDEYINKKIIGNLNKIKEAKQIKPLLEYDTLIINGKEFKNINTFMKYFTYDHLHNVFKNDYYADLHGDLTIENIICLQGKNIEEDDYYIIDPNTGNVHDSPFLDYAKLLQSLHGDYEFLMKTKDVDIEKNYINFISVRSAAYNEMLERYKQFLQEHFSQLEIRSIFYHEIVHWLRLMPYKIHKNGKRAVIFYAGLIMVLNEIIEMFEE